QCKGTGSCFLVMGEQIGPPSRPSSPNPQERVVKCGWLKKQRSIMKNWQQRSVAFLMKKSSCRKLIA
uniref:Uncharacterized protein n=1 Tax=Pavo cristatus TaxID=9049 RepID=A0A8C9EZE9_PAVCR